METTGYDSEPANSFMEGEGQIQSIPALVLGEEPTPRQRQNAELPLFWELLNDIDRDSYVRMRIALSSPACKHRRHHSVEINGEILNSVRNFVVRGDGDDWKRALVCGICWMPEAVAVNTRQLRLLLSKCKSSINTLFQNLGYSTIPASSEFTGSLVRVFPLLKDNFAELRKWTPRIVGAVPGRPIKGEKIAEPPMGQLAQVDILPIEQMAPVEIPITTEEPLPPVTDEKKESQ